MLKIFLFEMLNYFYFQAGTTRPKRKGMSQVSDNYAYYLKVSSLACEYKLLGTLCSMLNSQSNLESARYAHRMVGPVLLM